MKPKVTTGGVVSNKPLASRMAQAILSLENAWQHWWYTDELADAEYEIVSIAKELKELRGK